MKPSRELIALMPVHELLAVVAKAGYRKTDLPDLLARASLSKDLLADKNSFVAAAQVWKLLSFVGYELDDELYGLGARKVGAGTTELVLARAMQSTTLGEAMDSIAKSLGLVLPDFACSVKRRLSELHFSMHFTDDPNEVKQIFLELSCSPYHSIFRWLTGASFDLVRVRTARSRPTSASNLLALFNCEVQFEGDGVDIVYPREIEALPIQKRSLADWRTDAYQIFTEDLERHKSSLFESKIQHYVEDALRSGITSQELIAGSAAMSVATLRRKLSQERVSFRELSDKVFTERCRGYLDSGLTVEEVSEKLGYTDASSFRRAFRRVFGHTPAQYRQRNH